MAPSHIKLSLIARLAFRLLSLRAGRRLRQVAAFESSLSSLARGSRVTGISPFRRILAANLCLGHHLQVALLWDPSLR